MRRVFLSLAAVIVLLAAAAVSGVGRPDAALSDDTARRNTVTTVGEGTVTTVPDTATVSAGVRTEASTAADAIARNSERMKPVIAALRRAGGDKLQTQQVSVYPRTGENGAVAGFVAQNSVTAETKIAEAGALIDAAVAAGANAVEGPMLDRSNRDALYRDALGAAVGDARLKAQALARAGGFDLGRVVAVVEEGASAAPAYDTAAVARSAAAPAPIEPGMQEIDAHVTVSFEIL
jgi:uncharacterized protein YggE